MEGLVRETTFKTKHRKEIEESVKAKMHSKADSCLQILSYNFKEEQDNTSLRVWLHPTVKCTMFDRLRRQIEGEGYCQEGLLRSFVEQLVSAIASL